MKHRKYIILMIIFAILLCVSLWPLIRYAYNSRVQSNYYDDIASYVNLDATVPSEAPDPTETTEAVTEPTVEETLPPILPQYEELYNMNSDIVGWIKIEDTKINYPVMQTPREPDFYLKRDFNKKKNSYGCLYAMELGDINKPSDNITIYGHNMRDGSMFAGLHQYKRQSYWEKHSYFTFDTIREQHEYQIFAAFKTSYKKFPYHMFVNSEDEKEFDSFVATCKELSFYDTGITPEYGDKLVCLSTCQSGYYDGRMVVVGVRIS